MIICSSYLMKRNGKYRVRPVPVILTRCIKLLLILLIRYGKLYLEKNAQSIVIPHIYLSKHMQVQISSFQAYTTMLSILELELRQFESRLKASKCSWFSSLGLCWHSSSFYWQFVKEEFKLTKKMLNSHLVKMIHRTMHLDLGAISPVIKLNKPSWMNQNFQ